MQSTPLITDVFSAARWFDSLWNSRAHAVAPDRLEWVCQSYGSGMGGSYWELTATFDIVAALFDLPTSCNVMGRDELVVTVPMKLVAAIIGVINRISEDEPTSWPWREEEEREGQISVAAQVLGITAGDLARNETLLRVLQVNE